MKVAQPNPVYSICLVKGVLWKDATKIHPVFRLTDQDSGRILDQAIEFHTLELGRYNQEESVLAQASMRDRWLYWFLHAHEYEPDSLRHLFPEEPMLLATDTITGIAEKTEDKSMCDAREKAIRDQQSAIIASHREGKLEGKVEVIRTLEGILGLELSKIEELQKLDFENLQKLTFTLQDRTRSRS